MKIVRLLALLLAGLGVGGGASWATTQLLGPPPAPGEKAQPPTAFVPGGAILAPVTFPDGRLSGYARFQLHLEVAEDEAERLTPRVPLLLHAINMRTFKTPLASGPDGLLPDVARFRQVVREAADEAWGRGAVKAIAITAAEPA